MDTYDIGFWLITWMMLGLLGMELVGGFYWSYVSILSVILFIAYFVYIFFIYNKKLREKKSK